MPTARPRQRLAGPDDAERASGAGDDQGGLGQRYGDVVDPWDRWAAADVRSLEFGALLVVLPWLCASARVRRVGDYRCHVAARGSTMTGWKCR